MCEEAWPCLWLRLRASDRIVRKSYQKGPARPGCYKLARLVNGRVKASQEEFREAFRGRMRTQHRVLLRLHLNQIDSLAAAIATIGVQVEENLGPFRTAVQQVSSIPASRTWAHKRSSPRLEST